MEPGLIFILVLISAFLLYFIWRMATGRSAQTSTRLWLVYVLVGVSVVTGIILAVDADVDPDKLKRWGVPLLTAAFVFAKAMEDYWRIGARRRRFWTTLGVLGAAHFLFFLLVLPDPWRRNPVLIFTVGVSELLVAFCTG
jgi:peptidoglycan/LPS O-acetylase OafA/YrhL